MANSNTLKIKDIFFNTVIEKKFSIRPELINEKFEDNLENHIKKQLEGFCIKEGYVLPDSISILKRSIGSLNNYQFNGNIMFNVKLGLKICNIPSECVITAKIKKINKLGILAFLGPLLIILPRELHKNKKTFDSLKINNEIDIFVVGKTYKLRSKNISIYGKLNSECNKKIKISKNLEIKNTNNDFTSPENTNFEDFYEDEDDDDIESTKDGDSVKDFDDDSIDEKDDTIDNDELLENIEDFDDELNEEIYSDELDEEITNDNFSDDDDDDIDDNNDDEINNDEE